jgi:chromosome segregation ATPase
METVQEEGLDKLTGLEERITRAVQVLTNLRNENAQLQQRVKSAEQELSDLRSERKQVRSRIEKLLAQLDLLSAS